MRNGERYPTPQPITGLGERHKLPKWSLIAKEAICWHIFHLIFCNSSIVVAQFFMSLGHMAPRWIRHCVTLAAEGRTVACDVVFRPTTTALYCEKVQCALFV